MLIIITTVIMMIFFFIFFFTAFSLIFPNAAHQNNFGAQSADC